MDAYDPGEHGSAFMENTGHFQHSQAYKKLI